MKTEMIIAADIDVTKFALYVMKYPSGKRIASISLMRDGRGYDYGTLMTMYDKVIDFLKSIKASKKTVKMFAIEDYGYAKVARSGCFKGEVIGLLKRTCYKADIPVFYVGSVKKKKGKTFTDLLMMTPSVVKKFLMGTAKKADGKTNKAFLIVFKKFGLEFEDDNELDAFIIAELCRCVLLTEEKKTNKIKRKLALYEKEVINGLVEDRKLSGFGNYCLYGLKFRGSNNFKKRERGRKC